MIDAGSIADPALARPCTQASIQRRPWSLSPLRNDRLLGCHWLPNVGAVVEHQRPVHAMALKPARKGRSEREQGRAATLPEAPETSRRRISTLAILLLLASASIAGLVLGSTPHVVANLGEPAFLVCGVLLALSSVFGLAATLLVAWHEIKGNPASLANATRCLGIQIALLACFVCAIIAFSL